MRVFTALVAIFGWMPIVWAWMTYVQTGTFTSVQWLPVVQVQLLTLAIGILAGLWTGTQTGKAAAAINPVERWVSVFAPPTGMVIVMVATFVSTGWLHQHFAADRVNGVFVREYAVLSTCLVGYIAAVPAMFWHRQFPQPQTVLKGAGEPTGA